MKTDKESETETMLISFYFPNQEKLDCTCCSVLSESSECIQTHVKKLFKKRQIKKEMALPFKKPVVSLGSFRSKF